MINLDGYAILSQIYDSSNSNVYRGLQVKDQRPVILKYLKEDYPTPSELTRYKQEYEITRKLNLDGAIKAYELRPYKRTFVIILEDFSAISLAQLLDRRRESGNDLLSITEFIKISIQIAEGLADIHKEHVIHKDINPANIVLNPETGELKIIDFGISTIFTRENVTLKSPQILEGTLAYISPEQTGRMNRSLDYRTDFYSLGATFYELLTGQLPFATTDALELVHCQIAKQPVAPKIINPSIPQILSDIAMKLLAKTAEDRYQSAFGIAADLRTCLHQLETTGNITAFPLASQDICDRFQIPQKLYGREAEVETLLTAFERVADGHSSTIEMMLVAGYSGIGKSSLVAEIHKPNSRLNGYFIEGKFNQFQRSIPYSAIVNAFKGLIRQLLGESEIQLQQWREKLLNAMGSNTQVIIDVIPEVELIVGPQPPVPELGANEAQNRFNLVFGNFIRAFCRQDHPLVMFLDDLQWADAATLKLVELIMTDTEIRYLFLIGAYRDNEVSISHPLMLMLDGLQQKGAVINSVVLSPLASNHINQLLTDALYSPVDVVKPLGEMVMAKTGGNPFFVNQFLNTLYAEKLIRFISPNATPQQDSGANQFWHWDLAEVKAQQITDNVVDLMIDKLKKLPDSAQEILCLAACIGADFALETLKIVSQRSSEDIFSNLVLAAQSGFILPVNELDENLFIQDFKFLHDRVQQAAYALIDEQQKKILHLQIGRLLLDNTEPEQLPAKLFEIVDHLNIAEELIDDQSERIQLAQLNLEAGRKAKASTAYVAALEQYFTRGIEILSEAGWQSHYGLTFSLYQERSECEYLCGNFEQAEQLFDYILTKVKSKIERADIQNMRLVLYDNTAKFLEAIALSSETLKSFGVTLPATEKSEILAVFAAELEIWKGHLETIKVPDLIDAPEIVDQEVEACLKLLMNITGPAYFANQDLLALISLKMVNLSIEHGNSNISAFGYALWGFLVGALFADYEVGYQLGSLSMKLNEKFNNVNLDCKVFNTVGGLIIPWRSHIKESIPIVRNGYLAGIETGDIFLSYNSYHLIQQRIITADIFDEILAESRSHLEFCLKTKNNIFAGVQQLYQHFILNLKGLTADPLSFDDEDFVETEWLQLWEEKLFFPGIAAYNILKSQILFLSEDYEGALKQILESNRTLVFVTGIPIQAEHYFYHSLILTALYSTASKAEQKTYEAVLQENQEKMKLWADNCPENFLHKYLLIEAEMARIDNQDMAALDLYDRAISSAREQNYIQNEALGNELAAKFWIGKDKEDIAQIYMAKAYHGYQVWGASRKAENLEEKYAGIFTLKSASPRGKSGAVTRTSTNSESGDRLDLSTFIKASQAIASEIVLSQLLTQLIKILLENTGAQSGFLILETDGELLIEAEAQASGKITVLQSIPLASASASPQSVQIEDNIPLLSSAVVNYAVRTHDSVVLNDARNEGDFTTQTYIQDFQVKSVLCVPLINQGQLRGVAYLENNLTTGAFTQERVEIVQLLSGEAAISISNAQLYGQLQDREQELQKFLEAVERFVPEQFLNLLEKRSIADVQLGDQVEREMTVMFADIRDFTSLSEKMTPAENFAFINEYLGFMEPQIQKYDGFIDKYIGDAIMALFPNSADDAVEGALAMLERLEEYNQTRRRKALPAVRIGIGIHSGKLMLGTVGGSRRMDGTAIGDAVNLSSRVEGLTKTYDISLLITHETFIRLSNPLQYHFRFIEQVKAKGKAKSVSLLEIFSADPPALKNAKDLSKDLFEEASILFSQQAFREAAELFRKCLQYHDGDLAAHNYLARCQAHMI